MNFCQTHQNQPINIFFKKKVDFHSFLQSSAPKNWKPSTELQQRFFFKNHQIMDKNQKEHIKKA